MSDKKIRELFEETHPVLDGLVYLDMLDIYGKASDDVDISWAKVAAYNDARRFFEDGFKLAMSSLPERKPSLDRTQEAFNRGQISEFERGRHAGWNDCLDAIERGGE